MKEDFLNLWKCCMGMEGCSVKTGSAETFIGRDFFQISGNQAQGMFLLSEPLWEGGRIISLSGSELYKVLSISSDKELVFEPNEDFLLLRSGSWKVKIPLVENEIWNIDPPKIPGVPIKKEDWGKLLLASEFASNSSGNMPELCGVYGTEDFLISCNRINLIKIKASFLKQPLLIPRTSLNNVALVGCPKEMFFEESYAFWDFENGKIKTPGINGTFPLEALEKVFSKAEESAFGKFECEKEELLDIVSKTASLNDRISLKISPNSSLIKTYGGTVQSSAKIKSKWTGGEPPQSIALSSEEFKRFVEKFDRVEWKIGESSILQSNEEYEICHYVEYREG